MNPRQRAEGVVYYRSAVFPATPTIKHELYGYKFASFNKSLQDTAIDVSGTVAAVLRYERRENRRAIASRFFYDTPTHGVILKAHFEALPKRSKTIFNIPLSIKAAGYDPPSLLIGICEFLEWQCREVRADRKLQLAEIITLNEIEVLQSNQTMVIMYWLSAVLAKYCNQIGADSARGGDERRN